MEGGLGGGRGVGNREDRRQDQSLLFLSLCLSFFSLLSSLPLHLARFSSTENGNTNFAEYGGRTAVSGLWKTVVWGRDYPRIIIVDVRTGYRRG